MIDREKLYEAGQETKSAMMEANKPALRQIKYANFLLQQLGYEVEDYDFEKMNKWEVEDLINGLKAELNW